MSIIYLGEEQVSHRFLHQLPASARCIRHHSQKWEYRNLKRLSNMWWWGHKTEEMGERARLRHQGNLNWDELTWVIRQTDRQADLAKVTTLISYFFYLITFNMLTEVDLSTLWCNIYQLLSEPRQPRPARLFPSQPVGLVEQKVTGW